jgi:hypothetical protein
MREVLIQLTTEIVIPILQALLLALAGAALAAVRKWLESRASHEAAKAVTERIYGVVDDLVRQAQQIAVGDLKAKGRFDASAAIRIKAEVKTAALRLLGDAPAAAKALGVTQMGLEDRVSAAIEATIERMKGFNGVTVVNTVNAAEFAPEKMATAVLEAGVVSAPIEPITVG